MRKILIMLTVPVLLAALPASAQQSGQNEYAQNSAVPAQPSGSTSSTNRTDNPDRRICVAMQLSGSHVTRRVCRTAREWDERGGLDTDD